MMCHFCSAGTSPLSHTWLHEGGTTDSPGTSRPHYTTQNAAKPSLIAIISQVPFHSSWKQIFAALWFIHPKALTFLSNFRGKCFFHLDHCTRTTPTLCVLLAAEGCIYMLPFSI